MTDASDDSPDGSSGHVSRPLPLSGSLAVVAGIVAMLVIADRPTQVAAIAIVVVGLSVFAGGVEARHRGYGVVATIASALGAAVVLVGAVGGLAVTPGVSPKLELVPGLVGLVLLVVGLLSAVSGYERWCVGVGAGAILLAVIVSGLVYDGSAAALLAGAAATVVAWDLGEQAITGGEQVGRQAHTWPTELVHGGVTVVVGAVAVLVAISIYGAGVSQLPLIGLWTLFGAGVVLAAALYL